MEYTPPTWYNNYDNSHLIEIDENGKIKPNAAYQAYADEVNLDLDRSGSNDRLVWDDVTASFCLRCLT